MRSGADFKSVIKASPWTLLLLGILILSSSLGLAQVSVGTVISNTASAIYHDSNGNPLQSISNAVENIVSGGFALQIEKQSAASIAAPGDTLEYLIRVTNTGNQIATNITITDTLDNNLIYISSEPVASFVSNQILQWNISDIPAGGVFTISLIGKIRETTPTGSQILNRACFQIEAIHGSSGWTLIHVGLAPDLQLQKTVDRAIAVPGDTLKYRIRAANTGNATSTRTIVLDDLPDNVTLLSISSGGTMQSGIITWQLGELLPGAVVDLLIVVQVNPNIPTEQTLTNYTTISNAQMNSQNSSAATHITKSQPRPILELDKQAAASAEPGDTLIYTLSYRNIGPGIATQVVLLDSLPPGITFVSASGTGTYNSSSHVVRWQLGDLAPNDSDQVTLQVLIPAPNLGLETILNRALLSSAEMVSAQAEWMTTILYAELNLRKLATVEQIEAGQEFNYLIIYKNTGNAPATGVSIIDTLSIYLDFVSADPAADYDSGNRVLSWQFEQLNPGQRDTISIRVRANTSTQNELQVENRAYLVSANYHLSATAGTVTILGQAILNLVKTATPTVEPGAELEYWLIYSNSGNATATEMTLVDTLPPQLDFVSATGNYSYNAASRTITWQLDNLPAAEQDTLILITRVSTDLSNISPIINNAFLISQGTTISTASFTTAILLDYILTIQAEPPVIIGDGIDSTHITARLRRQDGSPVNDGLPVRFSSSAGKFAAGKDSTTTTNGDARTTLISDRIKTDRQDVTVTAWLGNELIGNLSASTEVSFVIASLFGSIYTPAEKPITDGIITLYDQVNATLIQTDTSDAAGSFWFPIYDSSDYKITTTTIDEFTKSVQDVEYLSLGPRRILETQTQPNKNAISGRIIDRYTQQPIREAGLKILLNSPPDSIPNVAKIVLPVRLDSTQTDTAGFYAFSRLDPGLYQIKVRYNGVADYRDAKQEFDLKTPGLNLVQANIPLSKPTLALYKTVDQAQAKAGDTLTYKILYSSPVTSIEDTLWLHDQLPEYLEFLEATLQKSPDLQFIEYNPISRELYFRRLTMASGQRDSVTFKVRVVSTLPPGIHTITNTAQTYTRQDTARSTQDSRTHATTRLINPFLSIAKSVNRRVVEVGDLLSYELILTNRSSDQILYQPGIYDLLPIGFKYKAGTTLVNEKPGPDPVMSSGVNHQINLHWSLTDSLPAGKTMTVRYRVISGLETQLGENNNQVHAEAFSDQFDHIQSNSAEAIVIVKPGFINDRGFIFGKVYYDLNNNDLHDQNEPVLSGAELITEAGIRVTTDEFGKYSIPNVRAGQHVLRINRTTLPEGSRVKLNASDFLGDPLSRLVQVQSGSMSKANFALEKSIPVEIELRRYTLQEHTLQLNVTQKILNEKFQLNVFQPWSVQAPFHFAAGVSQLPDGSQSSLRTIAEILKADQKLHLKIDVYTDDQPLSLVSDFTNHQDLSEAQAAILRNYLIENEGINPDRIQIKGRGAENPIVSNTTAERRAQNRRVELHFSYPKDPPKPQAVLRYQVCIETSRDTLLKDLLYYATLPPGFKLNTAIWQDQQDVHYLPDSPGHQFLFSIDPESNSQPICFNFELLPDNPDSIQGCSRLKSYLTYRFGEKSVTTAVMQNQLNTPVSKIDLQLELQGIFFDFDSDRFKPTAEPVLNQLGMLMLWRPDWQLTIAGHTDSIGTLAYNEQLSQRRAESVRTALVNNFKIEAQRIQIEAFGETLPIADNATSTGRAQNRRVELQLHAAAQQTKFPCENEIRSDTFSESLKQLSRKLQPEQLPNIINISANDTIALQLNIHIPPAQTDQQLRISLDLPAGYELFTETATEINTTASLNVTVLTSDLLLKSPANIPVAEKLKVQAELFDQNMQLLSSTTRTWELFNK